MATLSIATVKRGDDLKQIARGLAAANSQVLFFRWGEERVRHVRCIEDHSPFYIGWPLGFPIIPFNGPSGHPLIESISTN